MGRLVFRQEVIVSAPATADAEKPGRLRAVLYGPENQLLRGIFEYAARPSAASLFPLVVHGPAGSGKSWVARAVMEQCLRAEPNASWRVDSATDFCAGFQEAARRERVDEYLAPFRTLRVWVLDDLDALARAPAAQSEVARLMDRLIDEEARLIVTLSQPPRWCAGLQTPLVDRLLGGTDLPLVHPAQPTREALLKYFAKERGIVLPEDSIKRWAAQCEGGPRELESIVLQAFLAAQAGLPESAEQAAADWNPPAGAKQTISMSRIAAATAKAFALKVADLRGPSRQATVAAARALAMALARELTESSLQRIGDYFHRRDHTTVMHACKAAAERLRGDPNLAARAEMIRRSLTGPSPPRARARRIPPPSKAG